MCAFSELPGVQNLILVNNIFLEQLHGRKFVSFKTFASYIQNFGHVNITLTVDPQLLTGKENRALVSSASLGPQYLSMRFDLAGSPGGIIPDKSAATVIFPSVEQTKERCIKTCQIYADERKPQPDLNLQINSKRVKGQVLTVDLWTSDVFRSLTRISKVPRNPFKEMF